MTAGSAGDLRARTDPVRTDRVHIAQVRQIGPTGASCLIAFLTVVLAACGEGGGARAWGGSVDTLANGVVRIANPAEGIWDSADAWSLVEELRIGTVSGEGPDLFSGVSGLAVDDYGRMHVLDRETSEIRTFDAGGAHVRTVGRMGEGPGELGDPIGMVAGPSGELWVADDGNARFSVFDTAGAYLRSVPRSSPGYSVPWTAAFGPDGRLVEYGPAVVEVGGTVTSTYAFLRHPDGRGEPDILPTPEVEGELFSLSLEGPSGPIAMSADVPFTGEMRRALAPDGTAWFAVTDRYEIHQATLEGDTLRTVSKDYRPIPVTEADKDAAIEQMKWFTDQGGKVDRSRIPGEKPILRRFWADPAGHLWVQVRERTDEPGVPLDVFDPAGRYLGQVQSPDTPTLRYPIFVGDRLYAVTSDDLGVQYVVRLRIER